MQQQNLKIYCNFFVFTSPILSESTYDVGLVSSAHLFLTAQVFLSLTNALSEASNSERFKFCIVFVSLLLGFFDLRSVIITALNF